MTEEEILEGNKLIAEFMGLPLKHWVTQYNESELLDTRFNYHYSWNDLMPVVEKIELKNALRVYIEGNNISIKGELFFNGSKQRIYEWHGGHTYDTKIISTWYAVTEFIKWYNQNTRKNENI